MLTHEVARHRAGRARLYILHVRQRDLVPGEDLRHSGFDAAVHHKLIRGRGLLQMREMRAETHSWRIQT